MLLVNTGKMDDALNLLKKAVKDNPNSFQSQLLLGRLSLAKGDLDTAQSSFSQAAKINAASPDAQSGLAEIAMRRNDAPMLSQLGAQLIKTHPEAAQGYLWQGMAESAQKMYSKAADDYKTALQKSPDNPAVYLAMGQMQLAQGHTAEAQAALEKSLEKDPNSNRAMSLLILTDLQAKQPQKAIARVKAQIDKAPQNGVYYAQLADLQLKTNDLQGALASAQKAMQLAPESPDAADVFTRAEVGLGNPEPAISFWQNWSKSHPNDGRGPRILGTLAEAKGDVAQAQQYYKKALELNPDDAIAANNLAYLMVDGGQNPDVALNLAQNARRAMPNSPDTADTLAWVYYAKGNFNSARDLLESALRTMPDSPATAALHYHLGMTYIKLNDKANAQLHLKKAQTLGPNTKFGKDAGTQLQRL
jgi:tetratricopeptide (TPR) repeat protein